jgi:hypothetical protein
MATFDYAALEVKAAALLDRFGVASKLRRWTKGAFSPTDRKHGDGSTTDYDVTVAVVDYDEDEIDGTLVQRDDALGIMKGSDEEPIMNDKVIVPAGGTVYEIIKITPVSPDRTTAVVYMLQLRK